TLDRQIRIELPRTRQRGKRDPGTHTDFRGLIDGPGRLIVHEEATERATELLGMAEQPGEDSRDLVLQRMELHLRWHGHRPGNQSWPRGGLARIEIRGHRASIPNST